MQSSSRCRQLLPRSLPSKFVPSLALLPTAKAVTKAAVSARLQTLLGTQATGATPPHHNNQHHQGHGATAPQHTHATQTSKGARAHAQPQHHRKGLIHAAANLNPTSSCLLRQPPLALQLFVSSLGRTQAGSLPVRCHCLTDVWGAASPPQGPVFSGVSLVGATHPVPPGAPDTPGAATTYTARRSGHCHHSNKQQRSADDHHSEGPRPTTMHTRPTTSHTQPMAEGRVSCACSCRAWEATHTTHTRSTSLPHATPSVNSSTALQPNPWLAVDAAAMLSTGPWLHLTQGMPVTDRHASKLKQLGGSSQAAGSRCCMVIGVSPERGTACAAPRCCCPQTRCSSC